MRYVYFSLARFCGNRLRAISPKIPQPWNAKIGLKITDMKYSDLPGINVLSYQVQSPTDFTAVELTRVTWQFINSIISSMGKGLLNLVCIQTQTLWYNQIISSIRDQLLWESNIFPTKEGNSVSSFKSYHGPLARYAKLRMRMRRECWECFPRHRR